MQHKLSKQQKAEFLKGLAAGKHKLGTLVQENVAEVWIPQPDGSWMERYTLEVLSQEEYQLRKESRPDVYFIELVRAEDPSSASSFQLSQISKDSEIVHRNPAA